MLTLTLLPAVLINGLWTSSRHFTQVHRTYLKRQDILYTAPESGEGKILSGSFHFTLHLTFTSIRVSFRSKLHSSFNLKICIVSKQRIELRLLAPETNVLSMRYTLSRSNREWSYGLAIHPLKLSRLNTSRYIWPLMNLRVTDWKEILSSLGFDYF